MPLLLRRLRRKSPRYARQNLALQGFWGIRSHSRRAAAPSSTPAQGGQHSGGARNQGRGGGAPFGRGAAPLRPNAAKLLWVHKIHVLRHPAARVRNNTDFVSSQAPNRRKLRGGAAAIAAAAQRAPNPTLA